MTTKRLSHPLIGPLTQPEVATNKKKQKKISNINSYKFRDQNFVQKIWGAKNEQGKLKDKF